MREEAEEGGKTQKKLVRGQLDISLFRRNSTRRLTQRWIDPGLGFLRFLAHLPPFVTAANRKKEDAGGAKHAKVFYGGAFR